MPNSPPSQSSLVSVASVLSLIEMQITCRDLSSEKAGGVSSGKGFWHWAFFCCRLIGLKSSSRQNKQNIVAPQVSSYLNSSASQNKSSSWGSERQEPDNDVFWNITRCSVIRRDKGLVKLWTRDWFWRPASVQKCTWCTVFSWVSQLLTWKKMQTSLWLHQERILEMTWRRLWKTR